jgi:hypothetical protein
VIIESNANALLEEVISAFEAAKADVVADAQRRAGKTSRTGKFRDSITATETSIDDGALVARVGSPLVSARVKEVGGFIQGRRSQAGGRFGGHMRFRLREGPWVALEAFHIPAQPTVAPAGRFFAEFFRARLGEARAAGEVRGRAMFDGATRPDTHRGAVSLPR